MGGLRVCSHFSKSKGWYNPPPVFKPHKNNNSARGQGWINPIFFAWTPTPSPAEMYRDNTTNGNFVELHVLKKYNNTVLRIASLTEKNS